MRLLETFEAESGLDTRGLEKRETWVRLLRSSLRWTMHGSHLFSRRRPCTLVAQKSGSLREVVANETYHHSNPSTEFVTEWTKLYSNSNSKRDYDLEWLFKLYKFNSSG